MQNNHFMTRFKISTSSEQTTVIAYSRNWSALWHQPELTCHQGQLGLIRTENRRMIHHPRRGSLVPRAQWEFDLDGSWITAS